MLNLCVTFLGFLPQTRCSRAVSRPAAGPVRTYRRQLWRWTDTDPADKKKQAVFRIWLLVLCRFISWRMINLPEESQYTVTFSVETEKLLVSDQFLYAEVHPEELMWGGRFVKQRHSAGWFYQYTCINDSSPTCYFQHDFGFQLSWRQTVLQCVSCCRAAHTFTSTKNPKRLRPLFKCQKASENQNRLKTAVTASPLPLPSGLGATSLTYMPPRHLSSVQSSVCCLLILQLQVLAAAGSPWPHTWNHSFLRL